MRSAKVVIGANFGDEGKGLAVDALAARLRNCVVVRHNGGAQAGHTVVVDGRRHVFSHFAAGTFAGATTFLSRFFVVHPPVFVREHDELAAAGLTPRVLVDPDAQVTTPFDVFVNRWVEETRGDGRHGSVGIGFGETIERRERGYALAVRDLGDERELRDRLIRIRDEWLPVRLARLGVAWTAERRAMAANQELLRHYLDEIRALRHVVVPASIDAAVARRNVVFEGAQGLLLDQDRGFQFPFVTRSNTGLKNVLTLAADARIERLDVTYMTRAYLTRHGAGPLRHEVARLPFAEVVDPTNLPNPWQGNLRFAPLDLDFLRAAVTADLADATASGIAVAAAIGVTCVDQIHSAAEVVAAGRKELVPAATLAATIAGHVGLPLGLEAHGAGRDAVRLRDDTRRRAAA
jgi:adenylosuccinate synthase